MIPVCVDVDAPSAAEAAALARRLQSPGVGFRVGPRLLTGPGPATVSVVAESGEVFVDARIGGDGREVAAAVRSLAAFGGRWITVDHRMGAEAAERARSEAATRGSELVAVTEPPAAGDPPGGRGKAVSAASRRAAAAGFGLVVGELADVGIVAQVATEIGVWVVGIEDEEGARSAVERGAAGIVLGPALTVRSDVTEAVASIVAALGSADTIVDR